MFIIKSCFQSHFNAKCDIINFSAKCDILMLKIMFIKRGYSPITFLPLIVIIIIVGSRFVADRNSVGFARKTALTISFVERGFERLGLDR